MISSESIRLRPEGPGDHGAIDSVVEAAFEATFGSATEVALVRSMRERDELVADLTLVATRGEDVVGYVAFSEVTLDGRRADGLGLAPVAVAPTEQRYGIGTLLIEDGLQRAERAGWRFVVLLGHPEYYPRFGFRPAAPCGLVGDYGEGDGWMARPLAGAPLPMGHVRYCSSFRLQG